MMMMMDYVIIQNPGLHILCGNNFNVFHSKVCNQIMGVHYMIIILASFLV